MGGGDQRFDVGTVARIVKVEAFPDGRFDMVAVGTGRVEVRAWLTDDPYPRAEVVPFGDDEPLAWPVDDDLLAAADREVRRCLTLKAELDESTWPSDLGLHDRPVARAWQLAAIAPLGPLDQQRLLRSPSVAELLVALRAAASEEASVLAFRLGSG